MYHLAIKTLYNVVCMLLQLGHPIWTLDPFSVTVLGENGLPYARARQIVVEKFVYDLGNAFKNIAPVHPFVVKGSGRSDGEIVAFVPVPLCIHAI